MKRLIITSHILQASAFDLMVWSLDLAYRASKLHNLYLIAFEGLIFGVNCYIFIQQRVIRARLKSLEK